MLAVGATVALLGGVAVVRSGMYLRGVRVSRDEAAIVRDAGWAALNNELIRSRRHEHSFALLVVPSDNWLKSAADEEQRDLLAYEAVQRIQPLLRATDVAWQDRGSLYILLPECETAGALNLVARARPTMPDLFPSGAVNYTVFPSDGVTVGALLENLRPIDSAALAAA